MKKKKRKIRCMRIACVLLSGMVLCWHAQAYAQSEVAVAALGNESYLDGCDLETILGYQERDVPDDFVTYLDQIEYELFADEDILLPVSEREGYYTSLDDCLYSAVKQHLPLQIAKDKISLAKRKLFKSIRELFPGIKATYEHVWGFKIYKEDSDPLDVVDESQKFRSEKIRYSISQPLYQGGKLWNDMQGTRAALRIAKAEYKKVYYDISVEVARAYFAAVKAKTMLAHKERLEKDVQTVVAVSEEKMEAGLISEIEHLNVQSQVSQAEHDVQAVRDEFDLQVLEFKKVLHHEVDDAVAVEAFDDAFLDRVKAQAGVDGAQDKEVQEDAQVEELDHFIKLAYQNRPEFAIQKGKVEVAEFQEKVANAGWLPQINLVGETGRKAEAYRANDNNATWRDEHHVMITCTWNFGGNVVKHEFDKNRQATGVEATEVDIASSVGADGYYDRKNTASLSVFGGLDQYSKTKEAAVKRKEAQLELELSEKDIVSEVKEAYYNYNRSLVQLKSVFKKMAYRQKLVDLARHRSEINEIQISEYIQAKMDLVNERDQLYQTVVDYLLAKVSFNKAIGIRDYLPLEEY